MLSVSGWVVIRKRVHQQRQYVGVGRECVRVGVSVAWRSSFEVDSVLDVVNGRPCQPTDARVDLGVPSHPDSTASQASTYTYVLPNSPLAHSLQMMPRNPSTMLNAVWSTPPTRDPAPWRRARSELKIPAMMSRMDWTRLLTAPPMDMVVSAAMGCTVR